MPDPRTLPPLPDPDRFGGPGWLAATGGVMTGRQCLHGIGHAAIQQARNLWERLTPALWRRGNLDGLPGIPDSRLIRLAEEAALDQGQVLLAHGYRSALFGRALAHIDGITADPELLHICGLLHDVGIVKAITGEDFTLRSAAVARQCAHAAGEPAVVGDHLADALIVHTTIGIRPDRDGALGAYTQFGAMVDLAGLRLSHLPRSFVAQVLADHPRGPFKREILRRLDLEARALPGSRFDFVRKVGFGLAVRQAPFAS